MVGRFLRFFAYFAFFVLALIFFAPKAGMYYLLEHELKTYDVLISGETLQESGFGLNIKDAHIFVKSIEGAVMKECDITLLLLYNTINAKEITLSQSLKSFVPLKIDTVQISHTILSPLRIKLHANGEFGRAEVSLHILEKTLHAELMPSEIMNKEYKNSLTEFEKSENGGLVYDKSF